MMAAGGQRLAAKHAAIGEHWENVIEGEGTQPGPVEPLGYESQAEAAQGCQPPATVITLYRQRQIVGYGCNITID